MGGSGRSRPFRCGNSRATEDRLSSGLYGPNLRESLKRQSSASRSPASAPSPRQSSPGGLQLAASATATTGQVTARENVACGIDLESPEQFPLETDYWESEFYRANFSRAEIAYCMAQADPRQHFAARWCARNR